MAKQIPKDILDLAIDITREYWGPSGHPLCLDKIIRLCKQIEDTTGINWFSLQNLLDSIFPSAGVKRDATNEDVYAVLRLLGWQVSDE